MYTLVVETIPADTDTIHKRLCQRYMLLGASNAELKLAMQRSTKALGGKRQHTLHADLGDLPLLRPLLLKGICPACEPKRPWGSPMLDRGI